MPSIEKLQRLLEKDPNDPFVLYGLAMEHAKAGSTAISLGFFDRCIAADPSYCYAYYHKAKTQAASGDTPSALATIELGMTKAKASGDGHALAELDQLRDELS